MMKAISNTTSKIYETFTTPGLELKKLNVNKNINELS